MRFHHEHPLERSSLELSIALRRERGSHVSGALRGMVAAGRRMLHRIGTELLSRHHERMLASLDDRMLADIGIARHEIPVLVRSTVEQRHRGWSGATG